MQERAVLSGLDRTIVGGVCLEGPNIELGVSTPTQMAPLSRSQDWQRKSYLNHVPDSVLSAKSCSFFPFSSFFHVYPAVEVNNHPCVLEFGATLGTPAVVGFLGRTVFSDKFRPSRWAVGPDQWLWWKRVPGCFSLISPEVRQSKQVISHAARTPASDYPSALLQIVSISNGCIRVIINYCIQKMFY